MAKTIVITGGGRGIGAATAELAGKRGWSVVVNYAGNAAAAGATVAAVKIAGGRAMAVKGDVGNEADVVSLFDTAMREYGPIDGVVNNAGIIIGPASPLVDMPVSRIVRVMQVNVVGAYLVAREAARRMSRSRGGRGGAIVNLSSAAARLGAPNEYVDYAGSKGAIDSLTVGLAKELAPEGVRVNGIRPGLIETEIHASGGQPDRTQRLASGVPLGRSGTATEVAEAILWLLSDASSYVVGATLEVTGGR